MLFPILENDSLLNKLVVGKEIRKIKFEKFAIYDHFYQRGSSFPLIDSSSENENMEAKLRRECCGLMVDHTGKIISRPFHKIFYLEENEECSMDRLEKLYKEYGVDVLEKIEGSVVIPVIRDGKLRFRWRDEVENELTKRVEEKVYQSTEVPDLSEVFMENNDIIGFCTELITENLSPMFKFVDSEKKWMLILLGARHNNSGLYLKYDELKEKLKGRSLSLIKKWEFSSENFKAIVNDAKAVSNVKGFTFFFGNNYHVFLYTDWYLKKFQQAMDIGENLTEEQAWLMVLRNKTTKCSFLVKHKERKKLQYFHDELWSLIELKNENLLTIVKKGKDYSTKEFCEYFQNQETSSHWIPHLKYLREDSMKALVLLLIDLAQKGLMKECTKVLNSTIQYEILNLRTPQKSKADSSVMNENEDIMLSVLQTITDSLAKKIIPIHIFHDIPQIFSSPQDRQKYKSQLDSIASILGACGWIGESFIIEPSVDLLYEEFFSLCTEYTEATRNKNMKRKSRFIDYDTPQLRYVPRTPASPMIQEVSHKTSEKEIKRVNQYILGEALGEGAYGKVCEAIDTKTQNRVAIKIIKIESMKKIEGAQERLQREISIMRLLNHRNVIYLHEVIHRGDKKKLYLVLEFCGGGSIQQLVDSHPSKRLPLIDVAHYFKELIDGIAYIHSKGVIHRDIKPNNLLVTPNGELKICDFGVSKILNPSDNDVVRKTIGTPQFLSPEILHEKNGYHGYPADIWACGVTLYYMVVGKYPFEGSTVFQLYQNIQKKSLNIPDWLAEGNSNHSEALQPLLEGMLEKDAKKRWTITQIQESEWFKNVSKKRKAPSLLDRWRSYSLPLISSSESLYHMTFPNNPNYSLSEQRQCVIL